jgi:Na+-transporting NADH:ubiquinone oxidoreductase subunit NqrA
MKLKGGYNVLLEGRPEDRVEVLPEPESLYLPLYSRRFSFNEICVEDGRQVSAGDIIARDSNNFAVPLLAPRGGTVKLKAAANHIVLTDISPPAEKVYIPEKASPHIVQEMGAAGIKRYKLLSLGAWQFFSDAYTGRLPDLLGTPQAVIISTASLEPFVVRGDVQLRARTDTRICLGKAHRNPAKISLL